MTPAKRISKDTELNGTGILSEANGTASEILSHLMREPMRPGQENTWGLLPVPSELPPLSQP